MFKNQLKTTILLASLTALLLFVGRLLGGYTGLIIGLAFAVLMNFGAYFFSDKLVLAMYRAKLVSQKEAPDLHKTVKEITHIAGLPMPKLYIIPTTTPNAFATGRNPKHAAVACTEGILKLLNKDELRGVLAHEVSHIKNRDILVQTVAATIAGVISYIASMAQWAAIFGGFGGRDNDNGPNMISLLVLAILTPLIATIIQLAISRSREYLADETGARIIKNPQALASALGKLDGEIKHNPLRFGNPTTASLFIANPFSARGMVSLFSTHPPMEKRIARLNEMKI
ncbi:zinc metalloprotease HtpX [Candidatus Woesearchaeota archaeon]|nr:zinc metalloprotease HtpX [Candidatus Woesearchaeota archaeon]